MTEQRVSAVRNSPFVQDYVAEMEAIRDAETVQHRVELAEMAQDAMRLLYEAAMGVVGRPRLDEHGHPVAGSRVYEAVRVKDRITAAKRLADAHSSTASVARVRRSAGGFTLPAADVEALRARMEQALLAGAHGARPDTGETAETG
jgi:hypothetical protein